MIDKIRMIGCMRLIFPTPTLVPSESVTHHIHRPQPTHRIRMKRNLTRSSGNPKPLPKPHLGSSFFSSLLQRQSIFDAFSSISSLFRSFPFWVSVSTFILFFLSKRVFRASVFSPLCGKGFYLEALKDARSLARSIDLIERVYQVFSIHSRSYL